jgi:hypothetical protein
MMDHAVRALTEEDELIVWQFLRYAAHESSVESIRKQPFVAIYAEKWGRPSDLAVLSSKVT